MNVIKIPINNDIIKYAFYGYGNKTIDILELVKKHMDSLKILYISNNTFKRDPCPNIKKIVILIFDSGKKYIIKENNYIQFQCVLKQITNPLINILIRTTYRPSLFPICIDSILKQTYKNIRIICCYDDRNCINYLDKIISDKFEYFYINIDSEEKYKYNLYCNTLLDKVTDGMIIFLDDDDMFSTNNSLQTIINNITHENDFIYWTVALGNKYVRPINITNIQLGQICSNGFCFNSKYKTNAMWECKRGSDYSFVTNLIHNSPFIFKSINDVLAQSQHHRIGLDGKKDIFYSLLNDYTVQYNIKQIHVSKSLEHLKDRIYKKYDLVPYNDINTPSIFFGIYSNEDISTIHKHIGNKYIMFGGSDVPNCKKINSTTNTGYIAISENIYNRLKKYDIDSNTVYLNLVDTELFKPVHTVGSKIFIYDGICKKADNATIYGKKYYDIVCNQLPQYEYIYSSDLNAKYEEMPKIYSECFIGLRLTSHDGNANMVQEMEAMEIPVVHNMSKYGLKWKTADDVVNIILKYKKIITIDKYKCINIENIKKYQDLINNSNGDNINETNVIKYIQQIGKTLYYNNKFISGNKLLYPEITISRNKKYNEIINKNNVFISPIPYVQGTNGLYFITQSMIDAINDENSLLYPHVYDSSLYKELNDKKILLHEQKVYKEWYNWISEEEIKALKIQHFSEDAFIICICGRIAINSYPKSLLESIKILREQGYNIHLLVLAKLEVAPHRLTQNLYDEITSYDWVKSFTVNKKDILNYFRFCDILASTYRDYCNHVGGSNKIKEYLLCNKPILCSRGKEREVELGKDYFGFYDCETCNSVPPLCWTKEYLQNNNCYIQQYTKYFKFIDKQINTNEILSIKNIISTILYKKIHESTFKNFTIGIFQENLAIRSYKLGLSLYLRGYNIIFIYYKYYFKDNYEMLNESFCEFKKLDNNNITGFTHLEQFFLYNLNDIIFINAWETIPIHFLKYNPCYYIGDCQCLRYMSLKNGLKNTSILNEIQIFNNSNRLIFTNKYMPNQFITPNKFNINLNNYKILQNSLIYNNNFIPKMRDYRNKKEFNFVYIGSVSTPETKNHRNIIHYFNDIVSKNTNIYIYLYLTKNNLDEIKKIEFHKNIYLKNTINQDFITSELGKYDFGLTIFNKDYLDSDYLNISQPNKFFDYYFSNLPIISINTHSFNDFIIHNNLGIIINNYNIDVNNLQKVFFKTNDFSLLKSYQELLSDTYIPLNLNKIQYIYTSDTLLFFHNIMKKKFNLKEYSNNINSPTAFFGLYNINDLNKLLKHKSRKILIPGGSDINRYTIFSQNIHLIKEQKIKIYCQSKYLYENVIKIYPKQYTFLIPLAATDINHFYEPDNIKGDTIYIYTCEQNNTAIEIYGKNIYTNIIKQLKHKFKFILATHKTSTDVKNEIYKKCFVGLRLTTYDGLGATNIELGLMGIKCIANNISPNCLKWNNENDIIKHIENESYNIGKNDPELSHKVYNFIKHENKIFE